LLVATVSPSSKFVAETISTLKFADRAKNVMQRVRRNELISAESEEVVTKMQKEISFLKEMLALRQQDSHLQRKINDLQSENERLKRIVTSASNQ
jgi:FtsZ-binding cell division protein ZapB